MLIKIIIFIFSNLLTNYLTLLIFLFTKSYICSDQSPINAICNNGVFWQYNYLLLILLAIPWILFIVFILLMILRKTSSLKLQVSNTSSSPPIQENTKGGYTKKYILLSFLIAIILSVFTAKIRFVETPTLGWWGRGDLQEIQIQHLNLYPVIFPNKEPKKSSNTIDLRFFSQKNLCIFEQNQLKFKSGIPFTVFAKLACNQHTLNYENLIGLTLNFLFYFLILNGIFMFTKKNK